MTEVQLLTIEGHKFAIVPEEIWNRVKDLVEDIEDAAALNAAVAADDGFRVPAAVLDAQLAGDHPVKAWRIYRRITIDQLAEAAGISKPYISQIENGKRAGSKDTLGRLAVALDVPVDALTD
ncbi:helix-turn-helix domain-containing protein [Burkholderia cepacia]|uniref:helix-turn-helix domain-containing protein n=1 Tax=Burkholderia cepacia TaxID=292 RepID=UPI00075E1D4C|nr:helix-turn-helix transcriptional regulator [Burkholderia cepacia]KVS62661.1 XRE family transcriptional regulator [Burkholderia cepacia]